jgi:hypothetical protein
MGAVPSIGRRRYGNHFVQNLQIEREVRRCDAGDARSKERYGDA